MRDRAVLRSVENGRRITREGDREFLYLYQSAILLALQEAGELTETQCRYAQGMLDRQRESAAPGENRRASLDRPGDESGGCLPGRMENATAGCLPKGGESRIIAARTKREVSVWKSKRS